MLCFTQFSSMAAPASSPPLVSPWPLTFGLVAFHCQAWHTLSFAQFFPLQPRAVSVLPGVNTLKPTKNSEPPPEAVAHRLRAAGHRPWLNHISATLFTAVWMWTCDWNLSFLVCGRRRIRIYLSVSTQVNFVKWLASNDYLISISPNFI